MYEAWHKKTALLNLACHNSLFTCWWRSLLPVVIAGIFRLIFSGLPNFLGSSGFAEVCTYVLIELVNFAGLLVSLLLEYDVLLSDVYANWTFPPAFTLFLCTQYARKRVTDMLFPSGKIASSGCITCAITSYQVDKLIHERLTKLINWSMYKER